MKILKFGGSSVANADRIQKVLKLVSENSKQEKIVVVVSAFQGVTDQLIEIGKKHQAETLPISNGYQH